VGLRTERLDPGHGGLAGSLLATSNYHPTKNSLMFDFNETEFARIRRLSWSQDKGESAPSIHAFAAPVFDTRGEMVAAISVPFLAGTEPSRMEDIRLRTIAAAKALTAAIPGPVAR
jgi:DNA-binding IclR family transcriptional regulator